MLGFRLLIGISIVLAITAGCTAVPYGEVPPEKFVLGEDIIISSVDVSRMQILQARAELEKHINQRINALNFSFNLEGEDTADFLLSGSELPIKADYEARLNETSHLPQHNRLRLKKREYEVNLYLDLEAAREKAEAVCAALSFDAQDAKAVLDYSKEGMFAFIKDEKGRRVEPDTLLSLLSDAVAQGKSAHLTLPFEVIEAGYTLEQAEKEHRLIAQFSTSFKKPPLNAPGRVYNIKKAAKLLNGTMLNPGEHFSINSLLGARNERNGWQRAPGIREGRYEQEYGGGVCQVSSTLFNAVMMADLEVLERHPHSWPSSYVGIGRDATVSTGGPDFKFANNSSAPLYIFAKTNEKNELVISLYGRTKNDGVRIQISSVRTATLSAAGEEVLLDASLPPNTRFVYREARKGKKSETYKEYYDLDNKLIKKVLAHKDLYRSVKGTVYVSADLYYKQ